MIHRFTLDGVERGRFDHGVQGLAAVQFPPVAYDPRARLNIESPAFDSGNPATWSYAPVVRRVFGMAVNRGRLYYAVASGLRIWSVALLPDGSFGGDARIELDVPRGDLPRTEISEILFDDNGEMLLAERGAPTGAYDYEALAEPAGNRVLRFRPKAPGDPPSRDLWFPVPREYAVGLPPDFRNSNGGIAIGYSYDPAGNIIRASCGGMLWSTGEQLRDPRDPEMVRRVQSGGPLNIDGLQGNSVQLLRPLNEPPFEAYYIDYDDRFDDPLTRGHLGDVVIWRICGQAVLPVVPVVTGAVICPVGWFNIDGVCMSGQTCPAGTEFANGCCVYRGCPEGNVRVRGRCIPQPTTCNSDETYSEGRCDGPKCPSGLVARPGSLNRTLLPNNGGCPPGTTLSNDKCQPVPGGRPNMCNTYCGCPPGTRVSEDGTCKQSSCGPHMVESNRECVCEPDYQGIVDRNGKLVCHPRTSCDLTPGSTKTAGCCPAGQHWSSANLTCEPDNQNPKLTIVKTGGCVPVGSRPSCRFTFTITNPGPGSYSGPVSLNDNAGSNFSQDELGLTVSGATNWGCGGTGGNFTCNIPDATIAPGGQIVITVTGTYPPGSRYTNCVALGTAAPVSNGLPSDSVSCVSGETPTAQACPAGTVSSNGTCCTPEALAAGICGGPQCPAGARLIRGQCFFVDPACRGSDCPPVTSICPDGRPRNSDGSCPPPTTTTCPAAMVSVHGTCCNIRDYNAGKCGGGPPTTTGCPGGALRIDGRCPGSTTTGDCKSGQFRGDDGKCQNRPTTTSRCGKNETWNGETCVKDTKKKKDDKKERRRSESDSAKSSRGNRTKEINPSQLQRRSTQQFQRSPSGPVNNPRKR
jgi:hypothetical protein